MSFLFIFTRLNLHKMSITTFTFILPLIVCIYASKVWEDLNFNKMLIDISNDCEDGYSTSIRLSFGSGATDARIILVRSLAFFKRNCSVEVVLGAEKKECDNEMCAVVVVTEFFNYRPSETFCKAAKFDTVFQVATKNVLNDTCLHERFLNISYSIYRYLVIKELFHIKLVFQNYSGTIKITVTAAKYLPRFGYCGDNEIYCLIERKKICISNILGCDGNYNCGLTDYYDEYCIQSRSYGRMLYVVLYGLFLIGTLVLFFVQILRVCIPAVAEHFFIFNEGEENKFVVVTQSLPPFERKEGAKSQQMLKEDEERE